MSRSMSQVAADLAAGRTTSRALTEDCLARIADAEGEGARTFLKVHADSARAAAEAADHARRVGTAPSPYAGIPVSIKDLFDVAGETTLSGSKVLADAPPAAKDAPVVARLRKAGLVIVGRTNMTEFAYSGLGINPHYGTPKNPFDRAVGRIPGGSSSGAAVSVTDGMAYAGLGTDTGGSCRIPAALCGIVGFKPTQNRVPLEGALPLSFSLDSIGSLAPTVACCAIMDAIVARETPQPPTAFPVDGLRLAIPQSMVMDDVDVTVAAAFARTVSALSRAGARISDLALKELLEMPAINAKGGFPAAEAYAWHRNLLCTRGAEYDPRVKVRMEKGAQQSAADYIELCAARRDWIRRVHAASAPYDALILPTVPIIAPPLADLEDDAEYGRVNLLMLRNPTVVNFMDGCAISVPCQISGEAPVGLMIVGRHGDDRRLFEIAQGIESLLAQARA
ncbi:MAG: amidase [Hyphomicrobiales bacterium]|nr:amidase [Hyphomicrobiales bacterium]